MFNLIMHYKKGLPLNRIEEPRTNPGLFFSSTNIYDIFLLYSLHLSQ